MILAVVTEEVDERGRRWYVAKLAELVDVLSGELARHASSPTSNLGSRPPQLHARAWKQKEKEADDLHKNWVKVFTVNGCMHAEGT